MHTWFLIRENNLVFLQLIINGTIRKWHMQKNYFICNRFRLVFATLWKLQKWLVCLCICTKGKHFSPQKTAHDAQIEAPCLTKKETENVRLYALKVQPLVEKGWCNWFAATIYLKRNESFPRGLPEKLKSFAQKRWIKHTSTVMEPSIPFNTLVELVAAEDITNEKIRYLDIPMEINTVTSKFESQI